MGTRNAEAKVILAMWSRVAARGANLRRMTNAYEDNEDVRLTRGVVRSVMAESRGAP